MPNGKPYEVLATEFKENWGPNQHGKMMDCDYVDLKDRDGSVKRVEVNRLPTTLPPKVGETLWFSVFEDPRAEHGWKAKKEQGPRQTSTGQANYTQDDGIDKQMHPGLIRREAVQAAVGFAGAIGEKDLAKVEGWVEHIESLVHRAAGTAQSLPPPASSPTANGEATLTPKQQKWAASIAAQHHLSEDDKQRILKRFNAATLADVRMSDFDVFRQALVDPVPTGESDVPGDFEGAPVGPDDDSIPF